ncbi:hypothetical protein ABH926_000008 [Catenulispora sp. GP43]|uniref:DUF5719 family protein n=1 Tax=Catenulispora sp. GP43 TaxID=3156263 RepID=UPI003519AF1C
MTRQTRPARPGAGDRPQRPARSTGAGPAGAGVPRGRALAKTRTSPISTFGALGAVAVVLLAGLGYGFSTRNQDKSAISEQTSRTLPIGSATGVCQGEVGAGTDTSTTLTTFTPSGNAATGTDGAGVQYVDGKPFAALKIGAAGARSTAQQVTQFNSVTDDAGLPRSVPLVFQANGSYAPGFTSSELLRSDSGVQRGMAATPCTAPSTDFWFAGVSVGTADRDSYLYLANTDNAPATVNLTFFGQDGKIDTGTVGHDITVLPKTSAQFLLSTELGASAQASAVASVHVTTTAGRVAAQVLDIDKPQQSDVKTGRGMDFIPAQTPAEAAQTTQTIPGIPAPGNNTLTKFDLVITSTSDVPVSIDHVYWYGKGGRFELSGQTQDPGKGYTKRDSPLSIDPGKTVILNMLPDDRDKTESAALQIVGSGGSFVSGVRLVETDQKSNTLDTAYLAPTPPVSNQAIVADSNIGGAAATTLILTSTGTKGSTVQVTTVGADGKAAQDQVQIPANSTVAYTPKATSWFTTIVQPQPGSDPVYGARILSDLPGKGGMQVTAETLQDARLSAAVPPVAPDLSGAVTR